MGEKIVLTYETLFELLRCEKSRSELQELDLTFYHDLQRYLLDKQTIAHKKGSIFAEDETLRTERQIENAKKIVKELFERREKKIIDLALNKSKTHSELIPLQSLLEVEKLYFEELTKIMNLARNGILRQTLALHLPSFEVQKRDSLVVEEQLPRHNFTLLRFIFPVPQFLGEDLTIYGPYLEDEVATLPRDIARVILQKKRGEEITMLLKD